MKKILILLVCCLLLIPGLPGQSEMKDEPAPLIRVCLKRLALTDRADLILDGSYTLESSGYSLYFKEGSEMTLQLHDNIIYLYTPDMRMRCGSEIHLVRHPGSRNGGIRFSKGGSLYPGDLAFTVSGGMLLPVLTLSVEEYLRGVLPYEMSNDFPLEALKAQALCARTYALSHVNPSKPYDVVDTTNDQVYRGTGNHPRCDQAITGTAGLVVTYKGQLINCYYSASNGGQTETVDHVWAGVEDNGLYRMVDDPYDLANPESIVKRAYLNKNADHLPEAFTQILFNYMASSLYRSGYDDTLSSFRVDSIESVALSGAIHPEPSRFYTKLDIRFKWSGRKPVVPVMTTPSLASGSYGEDEDVLFFVTSTPAPVQPESVLGPFEPAPETAVLSLPLFPDVVRALSLSIYGADNELITCREENGRFVLESRRFGHGVGMSQRGAQWMAAHEHFTFDQIIAFYYPGAQIMEGASGPSRLSTLEPGLAMTPGPSASPTPRPTLMPVTTGSLPEGSYLASVEGIEDDSSLNLRTEPSQASDILMRLYKHQQLIVLETCEDPAWVHVKTDSIEGYVMVSFLEKVE